MAANPDLRIRPKADVSFSDKKKEVKIKVPKKAKKIKKQDTKSNSEKASGDDDIREKSPESVMCRVSGKFHVNNNKDLLIGTFEPKNYYRNHWVLQPTDTVLIHGDKFVVKEILKGKDALLGEPYRRHSEVFVTLLKIVSDIPDPRLWWELSLDKWYTESFMTGKVFESFKKIYKYFGVKLKIAFLIPTFTKDMIEEQYRLFSPTFLVDLLYQMICGWYPVSSLVDGTKLLKFCKTYELISSRLERKTVDVIFTKCRDSRTKRLASTEFRRALSTIAEKIAGEKSSDNSSMNIFMLIDKVCKFDIKTGDYFFNVATKMSMETHARQLCSIICIQSNVRRFFLRSQYKNTQVLTHYMQSLGRRYLARKKWYIKGIISSQTSPEERLRNSAIKIQMNFRRYRVRKRVHNKFKVNVRVPH